MRSRKPAHIRTWRGKPYLIYHDYTKPNAPERRRSCEALGAFTENARAELVANYRVMEKEGRDRFGLRYMRRKSRSLIKPRKRYEILAAAGFKCCYCGASPKADGVKLVVDHIVSVSEGGLNADSNLCACCEPCNLGKGALSAKG